ncbi:hypothetical protein [Actinoplanes regularis]|uniref:hypothetical protein n=1 Tax=Actinoplanes regularis TaxID=52697 RepID=UPI0024A00230|nr:hypothetical protein [Actinoplanes regularis]GLW32275.1 hypothetical protein Areg01_52140 [Actinoplanes regularis]
MPTTATPNVLTDPGYLFWAPLASTEPTNTVVGSKFTDSWPVAWISLGATEDGSEFNYETNVEAVTAAEFFDPIKYATTERSGNISFTLIDWTLANLKRVLNGGTLAVVSGTTTTQLNSYTPPAPGSEVRSMIGWESLDNTVRIIMYQTLNSGSIASAFKKAPDKAGLACQFNFETPSSGNPFKIYTAGTARA